MTLEELKVVITAETSGLQSQLNSLQAQMGKVSTSVSKSANSMSTAFSKLFKGVSVAAAVAALVKFGKASVQVGSDLAEVQNVVDVAFGDMASEVNDFAETAIEKFGLTQLQAKQFSSTFMAMANGMSIASQDGKEMAIGLTELAADMASFYNVSQDVAFTSLKSVFTGETETLKKFGVVMTEANLEAFALSQGIKKSYKEMTQAEKVALRYNFVLNTTKNAQGDYARTSGSWANQMKLLSNQWNELKGIVGSFLIQILTPMLTMLNRILSKLIQIGKALSSSFGKNSGATSALNTATSSAETNLEGANTQATKLRKTLTGLDELNVLEGNDTTASLSTTTEDYELIDLTPIEESTEGILDSTTGIKDALDEITNSKLAKVVEKIGIIAATIGGIKLLNYIMSGELFTSIMTILGKVDVFAHKIWELGIFGGFKESLSAMIAEWQMASASIQGGASKLASILSGIFTSPVAALVAWVAVAVTAVVTAYNKVEWFRDYVNDF